MPVASSITLVVFQVAVVSMAAHSMAGSDDRPVAAVDKVILERYMGRWYEIAKVPNRFQKQCAGGTIAEYAIRENGKINVVNRCFKKNGELDEIEGIARVVDSASNAKLQVSFFSILGWRPFWGDYWIIGLDGNYEWAVIGTPDRKFGWVLARSPVVDDKTMEQIFTILERNGYERKSFVESPQ